MWARWMVLMAVALVAAAGLAGVQGRFAIDALAQAAEPTFSTRQVERGARAYSVKCGPCHGPELEGLAGPSLNNVDFRAIWRGTTAFDLFEFIRTAMPRDDPGGFSEATILVVVAFVAEANGIMAADSPDLPVSEMSRITFDWPE